MFYFYVFSAQRILQRTPWERKRSIMHDIKYVYLCLCLFSRSTLIFLFLLPMIYKERESTLSSLHVKEPDAIELGQRWWTWLTDDILCDITANLLSTLAHQPINTVSSSYLAYRDTSSGTSECVNPFTVEPPGCLTADWWSRITR